MNRKTTNLIVILSITVVIIFMGFGFAGLSGLNPWANSADSGAPSTEAQAIVEELQSTGTVADLRVADIVVGTGEAVKAGDTVSVHYTGLLPDGTVFDSSIPRNEAFTFTVGTGQVIQGWELGLVGMQSGGRRLLAIPPALGYGANSIGTIPANSTLIFEVELLSRTSASAETAE